MAVDNGDTRQPAVNVLLTALPERRLIRPGGSFRHIHFRILVEERTHVRKDRPPLSLALVLDRSGSMSGNKLATAKRAALAVLNGLSERDRVAVTVFDNVVDVLQPAAPVTAQVKAAVREVLGGLQARASTALHEGWLTGCRAIAAEGTEPGGGLARCFLLTDGLANVGLTDPEQIATEAAGVREKAGIGTSTFGIGEDYDEGLLGPMAVAGGGQFHHLRTAAEIANTFSGELGELLAVAAAGVCLEVETGMGLNAEVISSYWPSGAGGSRLSIAIGDLLAGEERHVVVRFGFPTVAGNGGHAVRARVVWLAEGVKHWGPWCEVPFTYASDAACNAEPMDRAVMHWVGLHHAQRAKAEAIGQNQHGDLKGAEERLRGTSRRLAAYAAGDPDLEAALLELQSLEESVADMSMPAMMAKELTYRSHLSSRGQRDHRKPHK